MKEGFVVYAMAFWSTLMAPPRDDGLWGYPDQSLARVDATFRLPRQSERCRQHQG